MGVVIKNQLIFELTNGVVKKMKIILIFLFACNYSYCYSAAQPPEIYNPVQENLTSEFVDTMGSTLYWSKEFKEKFSTIRVKVFPHNSNYNAPHGQDTKINQFTVSSQGLCNIYKAEHPTSAPTSAHGITRKTLLGSGRFFEFTTDSVMAPIWVECANPIELKRADFPNSATRYLGVLFIKKVSTDQPYLTAVNVLPFEQYLKGVIPSEMPASWSLETLKAQAIAARTYAYYELGQNVAREDKNIIIEQSGAQLDDTVTYQAYRGLNNTALSTDKAVDETAGVVMTHNDKIIKAFFHADSGGHTENAENVWGVYHPYIIGKAEAYFEGAVPGTHWSYTAKIGELAEKLRGAGVLTPGEALEAIDIDAQDLFPSTRPKYVELKLSNGNTKKITAVKYAFITKIKSPWIKFSVAAESQMESQNIVVSGRGFGHGAGMNQWGARVMIDKLKKTYAEVLQFYYTDIQIVTLMGKPEVFKTNNYPAQ